MRAVVAKIGGREIELRLTIAGLEEIARVNPYIGEMAAALDGHAPWDWREVAAILGATLRPHEVTLDEALDDLGWARMADLASEILNGSLPQVKRGNAPAVAGKKKARNASTPGATSATA